MESRVLDRDERIAAEWTRPGTAMAPRPDEVAADARPAPPGWMPSMGAVVAEQVRAVGLSLRREFIALAGLLTLVTASIVSLVMRDPWRDSGMDLAPEILVPVVLVGALLPLAVWKSEGPGRRGYHRAMPVDHASHAMVKAFAGWSWLAAVLGVYLTWVVGMAIGTGGEVDYVGWRWIAPVTAATILYTMVTALSLVARHPWRWLAAGPVGYTAISAMANAMPALRPLEALIDSLFDGRYGLLRVITGLDGNGPWQSPLGFGEWLAITLAWGAAAGTALLVASRRIPEE
jgi:hypothetical protein